MSSLPSKVDPRPGDPSLDGAYQEHRTPDASNATRYLCVGAQIDSTFGHRVLRETLEQRHRSIAPSFGFDLVPVVLSALSARRRLMQRDTLLVLISGLNFLVSPVGTVVTALSWLWVRFAYRSTRQRRPQRPHYALWIATLACVVVIPALLIIGLLLALLAGALAPLRGNLGLLIVGPIVVLFRSSRLIAAPYVFVPSLAAVWAILLWDRFTTRDILVNTLGPKTYSRSGLQPRTREQRARLGPRLEDAEGQSNVTVYSGHFPFLGAGDLLRTWSFTVDLSRRSDDSNGKHQDPESFAISSLHEFVASRIDELRSPGLDPAQRLVGLTIEDRLFVSGRAVHLVPKLLPDPHRPPRSWVEPHVVQQIIDNPRGVVRHFKCYRVESWAQEIALSVFLHFTIDGKTLYVEQTACVLPPIQAEYHMVDKLARSPLPGETFNLMLLALKDVPASLLRAPVDLLAILLSEHQEYRQYRRFEAQLNAGLPIDYGAETSVRHLAADEDFHNYFQELDHFRHRHIIELHTLTAILDFLESKHIDTGEFRARQTTILNSGIFMPGGSITDSSVAGGTGATATGSSPGRKETSTDG
jgi:hypothetical protein